MHLMHPVGSQLSSDWFVKSFTMVVYENFFLVQSEFFCPKIDEKNVLIDNHYKNIHETVRIVLTSYRVESIMCEGRICNKSSQFPPTRVFISQWKVRTAVSCSLIKYSICRCHTTIQTNYFMTYFLTYLLYVCMQCDCKDDFIQLNNLSYCRYNDIKNMLIC